MYDFKKIMTLIRLFFFLLGLAFLFHVLGYGTPYWSVYKFSNSGLWNKCYKFHCLNFCVDLGMYVYKCYNNIWCFVIIIQLLVSVQDFQYFVKCTSTSLFIGGTFY